MNRSARCESVKGSPRTRTNVWWSLASFLLAAATASAQPAITNVSPMGGPVGTAVTVAGSNFGSTQGSGTVTFNGISAGTATSWSNTSITVNVPSGATTGNLVVTANGVATNGVNFTVTSVPNTGTATFVKTDATTSGNWKDAYGADGYNIIGDTVSYPSYVTVTPSGNLPYTWNSSTTDTRALRKANSSSDRVAATWYNPGVMTFDMNFNDTASHQVALYALDFDGGGSRAERVDILDANNVPLETRSLSNFGNGLYVVWSFTGHVVIRVTNTGSPNAVVSGFLFGPAGSYTPPPPTGTAAFVKTDTTTLGNWKGVYGSEGYNVIGDSASYPAYVTVTPSGNLTYTWNNSTTDPRALLKANSTTDRISAGWYFYGVMDIDLNFNDANTHQVALYAVDWDGYNGGRSERIDILDGNTTQLDTRSLTSFGGGVYLVWNLTGHVTIRLTNTNPYSNGLLFGLFFEPAGFNNPPPAPSISSLSPASGGVGTTVTITGSNFGTTQGSSTVWFNGTPPGVATATVTSWSASSITISVPNGATTGNVIVTVGGVQSNGSSFAVTTTPTISSLSPASGAVGVPVTISGSNFGTTQGSSTVTFNGVSPGNATSWSANSITINVPSGATTGNVVVTVGGVASSGSSFTVLPSPSISSLSPTSGAAGTPVTVAGSNFGTTQGSSTVTFNGISAGTATSWSAGSLTVNVPSGATTGNVVVTVGGAASNGSSFTVTGPPSITSLNPASGAIGTPVTLAGSNFGATQGTSTVTFNGTSAGTATSWSATSITINVPSGATTGNVVVTVGGVASAGTSFTVVPPPSISSLNPASAAVGAPVTLTGANFGATQGTSTVTFNAASAGTATSWSATSITVNVPSGATTGNVVVTVGGVASAGTSFTVVPTPSISSLTLTSGAVGASVTITGSNFGATQGSSTVTFNGISAGTATSWSASAITVNVPSGATTGNVVVNVGGVASNGSSFTVTVGPSITSLNPPSGPVGAAVIVAGSNFGATQGSSSVTFNGSSPITATSWSASSITVNVPAGAATGNVVVTVGGVPSNGSTFTVTGAPAITSLNPTSGPVGTAVTVAGSNFGTTQSTSAVTFNGIAAGTTTSWSANSITVNVPGGATTGNVVVAVGGVASNGSSFTVLPPPSINTVAPTSGTAGTPVTISGSGFGSPQGAGTVWLGSTLGTVVSWTDTQIIATVAPSSTSGTAQVLRGSVRSNAVTFTVSTATISGVTPSTAVAGTPVTITGSGFGATQGTGQVWLGTANGVVQTWSDTQIVAQVATGSTSGKAQVLQNGVWSNSFTFTVNTLHISTINPTTGSANTSVTITGTGFGSSQGTGTVLLGSTNGQVVSWSDTQVVAAVAPTAVSGVVRIQQNGAWSNAVTFTVGSGGNTLLPNVLSLAVGDTRPLQALSATGQPVTGLTWTSSDPSIVSLSTDAPPLLTALAHGHVTITAGTASADVTVVDASLLPGSSLPVGTLLWSNPTHATSIVPAVPSPSGVADVFAFDDNDPNFTATAITAEGATAWSWSWTTNDTYFNKLVVPDFQGGLVALLWTPNRQSNVAFPGGAAASPRVDDMLARASVMKLDGITGQPYPAYVITGNRDSPALGVHPDGTIFTIEGCGFDSCVIGINPLTGSKKFSVPLGGWPDFGMIVAGDGNAYVPYQAYPDSASHLWVLRVDSNGVFTKIKIQDWANHCLPLWNNVLEGVKMITNGDSGILLSWKMIGAGCFGPGSYYEPADRYGMAIVTGTTVSVVSAPQIPDQVETLIPVLQAQDGSFVGKIGIGQPPNYNVTQYNMVAFDATGSVRWIVPNEEPQIATADGGVIGKSGITYDQNGIATGQMGGLPIYSWLGNTYRVGSVEQYASSLIDLALSFWAFQMGNASGNGTANKPISTEVRQLIAQKALSHLNDPQPQRWLDIPATPTSSGKNFCNIFVHDVLKEAGTNPPGSPNTPWQHRVAYLLGQVDSPEYPAQSRDWARVKTDLKCWHAVTVPVPGVVGPVPPGTFPSALAKPGDVIAEEINYSDAFGHVGFVVGPQQTVSADSAAQCVIGQPAGTIDISDYGFRSDSWVDPKNCGRIYGKARVAVVKRFVCQ